jgi:hypothetical protein
LRLLSDVASPFAFLTFKAPALLVSGLLPLGKRRSFFDCHQALFAGTGGWISTNFHVRGDITVTLPGNTVTYKQWTALGHLVMNYSSFDLHLPTPSVSKFRARAWQAANDKTRELGWIP